VISDISMNLEQLMACSAARIGQMHDEQILIIWTQLDYAPTFGIGVKSCVFYDLTF
jgi:hypothetical protein